MTYHRSTRSAPDAPPPPADDKGRALHARHLEVLSDLMETGLRLAHAIEAQVTDAEAPNVAEGDPILAFHRVSRAVRLTIALQAKLLEEQRKLNGAEGTHTRVTVRFVDRDGSFRDMHAPGASAPEPQPEPPRAEPLADRAEVAGIVGRLAKSRLIPGEFSPRDAERYREPIERETYERLERESEFGGLLRRPTSDIIDAICRELGRYPDWEGLSQEPWAQREMRSGRVGEPLRPFSSPASGGGGSAQGAETEGAHDADGERPRDHRLSQSASPAGGGGENWSP